MADDESRLLADMRRLSKEHPRFGYRRIHRLLLREGWRVNHKRVQRLWRREGLRVPRKRVKRRSPGHSGNSCTLKRAEHKDHVWSYDFVFDRTEDGRQLKILTMVDEYTREALSIHVARSITSQDVVDELAGIMIQRGSPRCIRSDNGPEFIAEAIKKWLGSIGTDTLFVEPGSPWENAYVESFNGKLRDELLNGEIFVGLAEARYLADRYRIDYNKNRPHSSLGYMTPRSLRRAVRPPTPLRSVSGHTARRAVQRVLVC